MNEERPNPDSGLPASLGLWIVAGTGLLSVAFVASKVAMSGVLSFDGGQNFSVVKELIETGTHSRNYSGLHPFSIATDSIFIFLAALNAVMFGTGPVASQVPNALFALLTFFLLFKLLSRELPRAESAAIAFAITLVPGFTIFGFGGYGELPVFALIVGSLLLIMTPSVAPNSRVFAAGLVSGIAVSMKVVALIAFPAFAVFLMLGGLAHRGWMTGVARACLFALGAFVSYASWESYKIFTLGFVNWRLWWKLTSSGITDRAGITNGLHDTPSLMEKFGVHGAKLGSFYGLSKELTLVIVGILVAATIAIAIKALRSALRARKDGEGVRSVEMSSAVFFGLLASSYLGWWLILTPTEQAWLRRIFPGLVAVHLFSWITIALAIGKLMNGTSLGLLWRRVPVLALMIAIATSSILGMRMSKEWKTSQAQQELDLKAISAIQALPADAQLYGIGWYSAPQWSYHSKRTFKDLAMTPVPTIDFEKAFLILDHNAVPVIGEPEKRIFRYPSILPLFAFERTAVPFSSPRILKIVGIQPLSPAPTNLAMKWDETNVPELIKSGTIQGVRASRNGLIATSLVEGWIDRETTRRVIVSGATLPKSEYVNPLSGFSMPEEARLTVLLDGAVIHVEQLTLPKVFRFDVVIPPPSHPKDSAARLSITSNFVRTRTGFAGPQDPAQMSYILSEVTFSIE